MNGNDGSKYICPYCGGKSQQFGKLVNFVQCKVCGRVVTKETAEEHSTEVADGET